MEIVSKSDLDALWAKIKADMTHSLSVSGTDLKLTRELHEGDPLSPTSPRTIYDLGTISRTDGRAWLGLGTAATYNATSSVTQNSGALVTSGGVYEAINAALTAAMKIEGETTTDVKTNPTANPVTIDGQSKSAYAGMVVFYGSKEFVWTGTSWKELGDEGSFALKTTTVTGVGYLTGGGALSANQTIDIASSVKTKIDNGATAFGFFTSGILDAAHLSAANIVSALGATPVNRATADASGNNIVNTYATKATIEALDYTDPNYAAGKYVSKVTQTDGAITVTHVSFAKAQIGATGGTDSVLQIRVKADGSWSDYYTIPDADATHRGLITPTQQTFAGNKTLQGNMQVTGGVSANGYADLSMGAGGGGGGTVSALCINGGTAFTPSAAGLINLTASEGSVNGAFVLGGESIPIHGLQALAYKSSILIGDHYTPVADVSSQISASASGATAAWSIDVVKAVQLQRDAKGHVVGITVTSGKIPGNPNTDRYVNSAAFAYDSTNDNIKMTLTRAGSDTQQVSANIPKVSSSASGLMSKADKNRLDALELNISGTGDNASYALTVDNDTMTIGRIGVAYINSLS